MNHLFPFVIAVILFVSCAHMEDMAEPAAPSSVKVSSVGVNAAMLSWVNPSSGYDGVLIMRAGSDKMYVPVANVAADADFWVDTNLLPGETFFYRLSTYCEEKQSLPVECEYAHEIILPSPSDLLCEKTPDGVHLAWKDNCYGEGGYLVTRKTGTQAAASNWKWLGPDAHEVIDEEYSSGITEYCVIAYYKDLRSTAAECKFGELSLPKVSAGKIEKSWYMVTVGVALDDDGGEKCEVGVCWSDKGMLSLENGNVYNYSGKVSSSDAAYGNAIGLVPGKRYMLRCWARNSKGLVYSDAVNVSVDLQPEALKPDWQEITLFDLPAEIKLYSTETNITGRTVKAWYALADMSAGNVELKTSMRSDRRLCTVTDYVKNTLGDTEEVYVMVNGGYFDAAPQSFSYVRDRDRHLAKNIASITRGRSYSVTRGAFGVDAGQKPSVKWIYNRGEDPAWAYDIPLPVVEGEESIMPTHDFPETAEIWNVYSAIGGAPVLLKENRLCFDYLTTHGCKYKTNYELLQNDIFGSSVRSPRTAVGHTEDGDIVLMVVDGRGAGGSQGVTLDELALLMKGVGCTDALNLDGGGSTTMCITDEGILINTPSDSGAAQRKVCSFVGFVKRK